MTLAWLSEVVWNFYSEGRPNIKERKFDVRDIAQFLKLALSNVLRKTYYDSKAKDEWGEADFSLITGLLSIKRLPLSDADEDGRRTIDITGLEFYRFPKNAQFTDVFPVNGKCSGQKLKASTQVQPGERYYYRSAQFAKFLHHTQKNATIDTWNWPPCVKDADVECTFTGDEINVHLDVAYDAALFVLNMTLGIKDKYDPLVLRKQLEKEQALK